MRGGKEHARQTQPTVSNEGTRITIPPTASAGPSNSRDVPTEPNVVAETSTGQPSATQSSDQNGQSSESSSEAYHDVLIACNTLVEGYRKGEIPKATAYVEIQSKLVEALGDDRARTDAAFGSFIKTIESHDTEITAAGVGGGQPEVGPMQHTSSPALSYADERESGDDEPSSKRIKVDESVYAWVASRKDKRTVLRESLAKSLKLIEVYTIDPKATKRSLVNEPDCPEFPDSEWKNIISGRAVNLDAVSV